MTDDKDVGSGSVTGGSVGAERSARGCSRKDSRRADEPFEKAEKDDQEVKITTRSESERE